MDEIEQVNIYRDRFFQFVVHNDNWAENMSSDCEDLFSKTLDKIGIRYNRQEPVDGRYVLDFALHHKDKHLNLEIDGKSHRYRSQVKKDRVRDKYLWTNGWIVLRIPNEYVMAMNTEEELYMKYLIIELLCIKSNELVEIYSKNLTQAPKLTSIIKN